MNEYNSGPVVVDVVNQAIGATMLGVGIWLAVDPDADEILNVVSSAGMDDDVWAATVYTTIAVGAFLFLVGFLGCCGVWGDGKKPLLKIVRTFIVL